MHAPGHEPSQNAKPHFPHSPQQPTEHVPSREESLDAASLARSSFNFRRSRTEPALETADLLVSYPAVGVLGANYNPAMEAVHFEVEVDPHQVHGLNLLLFNKEEDMTPARTLPMHHAGNGVYTITVKGEGVEPGLLYGLLPDGLEPHHNRYHWLVDPFAKAMIGPEWINPRPPHGNPAPTRDDFTPPKGLVTNPVEEFERAPKVRIDSAKRVYYEADVGMTKTLPDELLPPEFHGTQGTFTCLRAPAVLDHLKSLGVTTVQLMPVQLGGDEWYLHTEGRPNVWGYMPLSFFALNPKYCHTQDRLDQVNEFKLTVDAMHEAGLEVIIDFVGGHTLEGAKDVFGYWDDRRVVKGPTASLRGLADKLYYHVDWNGNYIDGTGCEHTVNINTNQGRRLILGARDYWLDEIGVDGLRIDQATVFGRWPGNLAFDGNHPFLKEFSDADALIVAEPGDARGIHMGGFGSGNWVEQTFRDRDINRAFFSGSWVDPYHTYEGIASRMAYAVSGYADFFQGKNRGVRFADCHDGTTTWDETSGMLERLKMGHVLDPAKYSDPATALSARVALAKAVHASVVFSPGPMMISRGAELLRTQDGHHNPFDRPQYVGIDWDPSKLPNGKEKAAFLEYMKGCMKLRDELMVFHTEEQYKGSGQVKWFNRQGDLIERGTRHVDYKLRDAWGRQERFLAAIYPGWKFENDEGKASPVYVVRSGVPGEFKIPQTDAKHVWVRRLDTTRPGENLRPEMIDASVPYKLDLPGVVVFQLARNSSKLPDA